MTVTGIQKQFYFYFFNYWISKDIVWAYDFKTEINTHTFDEFVNTQEECILVDLSTFCKNIILYSGSKHRAIPAK
jgi:hypothetical protein